MAKGNLFQGMARGSVGDVVFTRINGKQISKQRNRQPRNPRTSKQKYQRAIMATVLQAYKAGQEIFNHAWQGIPVGGDVQAKFMKRNARLLRTALYQTMNTYAPQGQELNTSARVVHPRATVPVPNRYQLSQGSYNVECFEEVGSAGEWRLKTPTGADAPTSWEDYYKKIGLVEGDIYTFCWFQQTDSLAYRTETETGSVDPRRSVWNCNFIYARFRVLPPPTDAFDYSQPLTKVMEYTGGTAHIGSYENYLNLRSALVIGNVVGKYSWGVIRSREDSPLRSTSFMGSPIINTAYGIAPTVINEVWTRSGQPLGNSDLILEGGGDDVPPTPVNPERRISRNMLVGDEVTNIVPDDTSQIRAIQVRFNDTDYWLWRGTTEQRRAVSGQCCTNTNPISGSWNSTLQIAYGSTIPLTAAAAPMWAHADIKRAVEELIGAAPDITKYDWYTQDYGGLPYYISCQQVGSDSVSYIWAYYENNGAMSNDSINKMGLYTWAFAWVTVI